MTESGAMISAAMNSAALGPWKIAAMATGRLTTGSGKVTNEAKAPQKNRKTAMPMNVPAIAGPPGARSTSRRKWKGRPRHQSPRLLVLRLGWPSLTLRRGCSVPNSTRRGARAAPIRRPGR